LIRAIKISKVWGKNFFFLGKKPPGAGVKFAFEQQARPTFRFCHRGQNPKPTVTLDLQKFSRVMEVNGTLWLK